MEIGGLEVFPMQSPSSSPTLQTQTNTQVACSVNSCLASSPQILTIKPSAGRLLPLAQESEFSVWTFEIFDLGMSFLIVRPLLLLFYFLFIGNDSDFAFANKGFGFCTSRWASLLHKASLAGAELGSCGIFSLPLTSSLLNVPGFWQPLHLFCGLGF